MNERTAFAAMDETAEWSAKNVLAMRRIEPKRSTELQRYVLEGPYKRPEKNSRLGALILLVSASTVCFSLYWIFK